MEIRLDLYYRGNTVAAPKPSGQRKKKNKYGLGYVHEGRDPFREEKVCATSRCVWCDWPFPRYRIVCNNCKNCQWCGYVAYSGVECFMCGNHMPLELLPVSDQLRLGGTPGSL